MKSRIPLSLVLAGSAAALVPLACSAEPVADSSGGGGASVGGSSGAAGSSGQSGSGGTSAGVAGMPGGGGTSGSAAGGASGAAGTGNTAGVSAAGAGGGGAAGSGGAGGEPSGGMAGGGGTPAGSGGMPAGGGGMAGTAGMAGSGGGAATGSPGCGKSTTQSLNQWVESMVMSGSGNRPYSVYLPTGYDPMRAYPVLVLLHGCGNGMNNLPMERQTGTDAILIRGTGSAADTCWDSSANGPDVAFVDAMVADTKARFCADTSRFFAVGYSSGSWLANRLGCIRADVFRGLGTVAGGNPGVNNCTGPIAHMFVHDSGDTSNQISGSVSARDRLLTQNGCDMTTMPQEPSPCVRYQGCDPGYPVVWCQTTGQNHNRQDSLAAPAFWTFFREL